MSKVNLTAQVICNCWFCTLLFLLGNSGVAQSIPAGEELAENLNFRPIQVQKLVTRDLEVYQPADQCRFSVDGIVLSDQTVVPWWNVLSVEGENVPEETRARITAWQAKIGRQWLLLRNRLARGEDYGVPELTSGLLSAYDKIREANLAGESSDIDQSEINLSFAGEIELLRWLIASQNDKPFVMKMTWYLRQHSLARGLEKQEKVSVFLPAYRLVNDWRVDGKSGLCWQMSPAVSPEQVEAFGQQFRQQNDSLLDRSAVRTLHAYRLLSAAADGEQLRQQWLLLERTLCFSESIWQELLGELLGEAPDLTNLQQLLTQIEEEGRWAEVLAANWLVGRKLLASDRRERWTLGANCLLKIAFVQEQSLRNSQANEGLTSDATLSVTPSTTGQLEWAKSCLRLVADKFGEVGEPGKMRSLLQHLENLETDPKGH